MIKKICVIIFMLLIYTNLFTSCDSFNQDKESTSEKTKETGLTQADAPLLKKSDAKIIYDVDNNKRKIKIADIGTLGFNKNFSIGYGDTSNTEGIMYETPFVCNDLIDNTTYLIETPKDLGSWTVSSGSTVTMKGRYTYAWYSFSDAYNESNPNKMIRIDAKEKKIKVLESKNMGSPFIYLSKLNEEQFIMSYGGKLSDGVESVVSVFDVSTNKEKEIIREVYKNSEKIKNSTGILLENVCAFDNKIYAIGRKKVDDKYLYYMYIYNTDGKLQKTIEAQELEKTLEGNQAVMIYVIGDYLMFPTFSQDNSAIYKIEENTVKLLVSKEEKIRLATGMENLYDSNNHKYIYYTHRATDDGEHVDNFMFAIELSTGKIRKIEVGIDNEKKFLSTSQINGDGDVILSMVSDHLSSEDRCEYYVENETLVNIFENAPVIS